MRRGDTGEPLAFVPGPTATVSATYLRGSSSSFSSVSSHPPSSHALMDPSNYSRAASCLLPWPPDAPTYNIWISGCRCHSIGACYWVLKLRLCLVLHTSEQVVLSSQPSPAPHITGRPPTLALGIRHLEVKVKVLYDG
uniref:Uncharacterized protein n=1 Tax=Eutreptiella gymnastica TaxID=73025 RepID=A0A7S4LKC0_9EUGL